MGGGGRPFCPSPWCYVSALIRPASVSHMPWLQSELFDKNLEPCQFYPGDHRLDFSKRLAHLDCLCLCPSILFFTSGPSLLVENICLRTNFKTVWIPMTQIYLFVNTTVSGQIQDVAKLFARKEERKLLNIQYLSQRSNRNTRAFPTGSEKYLEIMH